MNTTRQQRESIWVRLRLFETQSEEILRSVINTFHMYSGITSGRVLDGEFLYTKILEGNLFAFA